MFTWFKKKKDVSEVKPKFFDCELYSLDRPDQLACRFDEIRNIPFDKIIDHYSDGNSVVEILRSIQEPTLTLYDSILDGKFEVSYLQSSNTAFKLRKSDTNFYFYPTLREICVIGPDDSIRKTFSFLNGAESCLIKKACYKVIADNQINQSKKDRVEFTEKLKELL